MPTDAQDLAWLVQTVWADLLGRGDELKLPLPPRQALDEITPRVIRNFESGRFARFRQHRCTPEWTPASYVERVIRSWIVEAENWRRLCRRDEEAWAAMQKRLQRAARQMLAQLGARANGTAEDYAQAACERMIVAEYPFDVPLNAWAFSILQNEIRARRPRRDALGNCAFSLDASADLYDFPGEQTSLLADPRAERMLEGIHDRDLVARLLAQLTARRREVILQSYFEGAADAEIAQALGTSVDNVQMLRHRALEQLLKILSQPMTSKRRSRHPAK